MSAGFKLDNTFHEILFDSCNKRELWLYLINLIPDYQRFRIVSTQIEDKLKLLLDEHTDIFNFIKDKDVISSQQAYKTHIYTGLNVFHQLIETKPHYFIS
ncbi:MAG: hypothetical protein BEN18_01070 [Epulopiscium sp. Nuni2H_MBin001]|nr:MAG: hypothetical protein BEN18_01070 [Epulopiscium sp. Nuni2H_MBin001]